MKQLMTAIALCAAAFCVPVQAADPTCDAQATEKKLAGAARASFTKKCEADQAAAGTGNAACETKATEKKLAGAAKGSFIKKCEHDANAAKAASACEMQATEKKLAGAAKSSFVKKCAADAAKA
jgi:hypothetical protein